MTDDTRAASRLFRFAAVYGVLVLLPIYFFEPLQAARGLPALGRPEFLYGFVGASLAFQGVYWLIANDPRAFRPLMLTGVACKLSWGVPVVLLWLAGRADAITLVFGGIDLIFAVLFLRAWRSVGPGARH